MPDLPAVFAPSKGKISNRRFIERLKEWGWVVTKTSGDYTYLTHINTYDHIKVRSAHIGQGNSVETFNEVLRKMDMSWDEFMCTDVDAAVQSIADKDRVILQLTRWMEDPEGSPPPKEYVDYLHGEALAENATWDRRQQRKAREAEKKRAKENRIHMPDSDEVVDLTAAEKEAFDAATLDLRLDELPDPQGSRIIDRVFEYLTDNGEPQTTAKIASACKIKPSQATGALLALVQYGIAERVKSGVYRVAPAMAQGSTIHHNVQSPVPVVAVDGPAAPTPTQMTPATRIDLQTPVQVDAVQAMAAEEAVVNDVLDLMFPNGMRIKAADITLLEQWKDLTITVMRRVGG